ncbi:GmrSD restriction endonuclease domain-containing protein [Allocoleopsis franciscana]|uniref:GmrSD restriction endonucleases N-terminal domain-containing protein n=1 Tax=Allocoleopsis franciscana PCC 7113 TaxID=1173027 RepID=K9WHG6_9CYAN|nr:DUF262 domain-containing protein [Allocoleopsis franciscana]AFZ19214.1 hypothetical protein Mic7113_3487 [Allocoleopsis franciscana PCC 7113]
MPHLVTEERFRVVRSTPLLPTSSTNKGMTSISTFDITKEPLLDLLRDIQQGKIQLVDFQRSWCWDEERIERVIASVSLGFPVGAVMLLQQGNPDVKFKPRLVESLNLAHPPVPTALILDGQQRLTSLFMCLLSDQPVRIDRGKRYPPEQRWYYIDIAQALDYPHTDRRDAIWGLTVDKKLYRPGQPVIDCSTPKKEFELGLFPISQVFNFPQWRSQYCKYWHYDPQKLALIDEFEATVIKKFEHYQMGLFVLRAELPKEAVCYIFEENNKRQCELTQFDLLTSSFAAADFDLRSDWIAREKRFSSHPVLRLLKPTDFLQAIALMGNYARRVQAQQQGCHPERLPGVACNRQDVLGLELAQYQHWMEPISAAFEEVARFLHTQAIFDANDLPYPMQLVVMAPLFAILKEGIKLDWVRQHLQQWFYSGAASGIYSRSREATAGKDLLEVPKWIKGGEVPSTVKEAHLSAERLQSLVNSQGATYRAIAALLRRDGALDFVSGEPITAARYFDEKIENHHIFPQQWCKQQGIPRSRYNSIINKTPLTAKTNKFLGGKAPSEYLAKLGEQGMSRQRINEILRSHLIEPTTLHNDDFEAFFELRTQALLAKIGRAMGKSLVGESLPENGSGNGFHPKRFIDYHAPK